MNTLKLIDYSKWKAASMYCFENNTLQIYNQQESPYTAAEKIYLHHAAVLDELLQQQAR